MPKKIYTGYILNLELQKLLSSILDPYEDRLFRGFYYKVRVGNSAWVSATPQTTQETNITYPRTLSIPPGREVVVRSWEKFDIPKDIFVTIKPEDLYLSKGLLLVTREFLEPNTTGYIFFTLSNLSDDTVEIQQGEELASVFFTKLRQDVEVENQVIDNPPVLPRLLKKEIETHPELVARVDKIEESVNRSLRNDFILLDLDIKCSTDLIKPYCDSNLLPDGYRFCVGDRADVFNPQKGSDGMFIRREPRYISEENYLVVRPGHTVIIRTLEQINLPLDVTLELSPLSGLSKRYLNFDGKGASPGYQGYLWCNLHNYGTSPCELKYKEPVFRAKFTRLGTSPARPIGYGLENEIFRVTEIPEFEIPEPPTSDWADLVSLTKKVNSLEADMKDFRTTKQIIELVFMAGVAGILAGIFLTLFPSGTGGAFSLDSLDPKFKVLAVVVVIVVYLYIYLRRRRR